MSSAHLPVHHSFRERYLLSRQRDRPVGKSHPRFASFAERREPCGGRFDFIFHLLFFHFPFFLSFEYKLINSPLFTRFCSNLQPDHDSQRSGSKHALDGELILSHAFLRSGSLHEPRRLQSHCGRSLTKVRSCNHLRR